MHYYKRHIGDYAKKAGHLSLLEHGVYNLIIDSYYDREQAPTLAEAMRWARARTEDEKAAVLVVLDEFFTLEGDRYCQKRIQEELDNYHGKAETNRLIALERERLKREQKEQAQQERAQQEHEKGTEGGRKTKTRARTEHEPCTTGAPEDHESSTSGQPNHKPLTTNQEPITNTVNTTVPPGGETPEPKRAADVFTYWQKATAHPRAKLDDKRMKAIRARLKDGYSVEDLCRAVDGIARSPYHMGQNDSRMVYDDIELICRSAANVDKFMRLTAATVASLDPGLQRQVDILQEWMDKNDD